MAMLGLGAAEFKSDVEIMGCLAAGGTREQCGMPSYCFPGRGWDPRSWFRGVLPQCQPYTTEELRTMTRSQVEQVCGTSSDPAACSESLVRAADIATHTPPPTIRPEDQVTGECEYRALEEHPTLSRILSPEVFCKFQRGEYTLYLVVGGAALLWALTRRS